MYKKSIVLVLLLSSLLSYSQEVVNSIPLVLKKDQDVFQIVNNLNKEVSLFVSDKKKVKAIRLNEKMEVIDSLSTERPDKSYTQMIGYNEGQSNPRLFWSSSNHKEVYSQLYDFKTHLVSGQKYSLPLKEERFLQNFSGDNKFYILTVLKNTSIIQLYVFDNDGKLKEKTIDLATFRFFTSEYKRTNLYGALQENLLPFETSFSLQKITTESPTSLTEAAKKRKCYSNAKQIILTFDTKLDYTHLVIIDLEKYTATEKFITKPFINFLNPYDLNSNSFLMDDHLFQIKLSSEKMFVTVKDLNDTLIKEYTAIESSPIDFKNSEIHQQGSELGGNRILDKTSQFLRKVNNSNSGISCSKINGDYLITLGSVSEERTGSAGMFGAGGVLLAYAINPTYENFNSYSNRKVVYIDCLFDKDFNHVDTSLKPLAFDKIREYLTKYKGLSSETIYKLDDSYYLGYYYSAEKLYKIRKFED